MYKTVAGGFSLTSEDEAVVLKQRAITKDINDKFIQVGAVHLRVSSKDPMDENWANSSFRDTDLQSWIDDPEKRMVNTGFNLQLGWLDVDIDVDDHLFNDCLVAALDYNGVDTRFRFGRKSVGRPTHVFVKLRDDEAANYTFFKKFEPKEFRIKGKHFKTQLRSYATSDKDSKRKNEEAKQTVVPGSIYKHKEIPGAYDLSVWYSSDGSIATNVSSIASTTPRECSYTQLVRSIAFATMLYVLNDVWVEGERQITATKISGWLARVIKEGAAINNNDSISAEVFCPIDCEETGERLIEFVCGYLDDPEIPMRIRTMRDAIHKLERNPDAKIPGWPAIEALLGAEKVAALRAVFTPGSDTSILTVLADRYVYDETDNKYIDKYRHKKDGVFLHENHELIIRHKGDAVKIGNKRAEAFKVFESSDMRIRVDRRDLYPDLPPGCIFRATSTDEVVPDDADIDNTSTVFNTWRGLPVLPTNEPDQKLLDECTQRLNRLFGYLTQENVKQSEWLWDWTAWTMQFPGYKQQIAPVIVGGQGVGKSFFGNKFMKSMLGRLWGAASPKVMETGFSVEPFIDKLFVFIDEAKFNGDASTDEIKKLIRNIDVGGAEKFVSARDYRIFARLMFASNRHDVGAGQKGVFDRALFYCMAYDQQYMGITESEFRVWAEGLKPWFYEFNNLLDRRDVREHYMYLFMNRKLDRERVESIQYSSSSNPTIVIANMGWHRQIACRILRDGWIVESTAIEVPFTESQLNTRVNDLVKEMGFKTIQGSRVLAEFESAGLIEYVTAGFKKYRKFRYKIGTTLELYGKAIGFDFSNEFDFVPERDFGDNDAKIGDRIEARGITKAKF